MFAAFRERNVPQNQVKPRTSERDEAAGRGYERWWFPPCSQPRRNVLPGDGIASVTVCPGTTGAWTAIVTRGEH